tara:strand:- start:12130 stop:12669 length:540 start_codon:yes stop_codon:yes gene_type:complete
MSKNLKALKSQVIDLDRLLKYFKDLSFAMEIIYPEKITWKNVEAYNYDFTPKHPAWVQAHFPLILIHHKPKAGKLREKARTIDVMYQNHNNIMTQLVWSADNFGMMYRKNVWKGFKNIVAAVQGFKEDRKAPFEDWEKPIKYKNFVELRQIMSRPDVSKLCDLLEEIYPCDSTGQLKMF